MSTPTRDRSQLLPPLSDDRMTAYYPKLARAGHTLVELMTAMLCSVMLLAGLGAVMKIAWMTAYTPTASVRSIEASQFVNELADELRFATMIVEHTDEQDEQTLEFVVADRNGDGRAERIRYDWPLHPDPDERAPDDPPQIYKTIINDAGSPVTWAVIETAAVKDDEVLPPNDWTFRFSLLESNEQIICQLSVAMPLSEEANKLDPLPPNPRIDTAVCLLNSPELLSAYWRADFDLGTDPLTIDVDGSDDFDWVQSGGEYRTNPANNFTGVTVVEARCRDTSTANDDGPEMRINADRQAGTWGSIAVKVELQNDGSQMLTLVQGAADTVLQVVDNLSAEPVCFRVTINPTTNAIVLEVNNEDIGSIYGQSYSYIPYAATGSRRFVAINDDATAEFDYVEVRVAP